ncbi:EVE domain-containing protein [Lacihabitans sp. CS3-21]|jgi:predicted RNA-binding protein with PUA-like domain|uniref:EVE domain-containing protein n=1 Tax=Lacihabitans sp. CS3-21 TaxID=2487332 RepID=UPI000BD29802|nr:EVE domain-containing protein [Lacihabitans sp. CS3-21]MCP9748130.1 EVE domain-containing protein [Lacihabitans sp. CS3-21]MDP1816920.1 EVE domain-containing protein [Leadbetterella sp.]OYU67029.1 MAG: ubiquinol-cytochrome C reductase [Cytophagaceae bacterium BCCC1]
MNYWLVKSEPFKFSWDFFVSKGGDMWDGVRNYAARLNLVAMKEGDLVLFYHSNEGLEVVGIAKVAKEHYPDPTAEDPRWVVVDLVPVEKLPKSVSLKTIKTDPILQNMAMVKLSRLSVVPVKVEEFDRIMELANEI